MRIRPEFISFRTALTVLILIAFISIANAEEDESISVLMTGKNGDLIPPTITPLPAFPPWTHIVWGMELGYTNNNDLDIDDGNIFREFQYLSFIHATL